MVSLEKITPVAMLIDCEGKYCVCSFEKKGQEKLIHDFKPSEIKPIGRPFNLKNRRGSPAGIHPDLEIKENLGYYLREADAGYVLDCSDSEFFLGYLCGVSNQIVLSENGKPLFKKGSLPTMFFHLKE